MEEGGCIMAAQNGSSSIQRNENFLEPNHSIFLSHSGAQKSFVAQLCVDIQRHDRYPFFDKHRDSLSVGCHFPDLIFKAINQCQVAVVVLSEEFFSRSKWPMLELATLVKRKTQDPKLVIMPIFLGMTHSQCCQKINHTRWLRVWQGWAKVDSRINLEEWFAAWKVFGYTNGISLNDEMDEVKCRQEIVEAICKEVPPKTKWDDSHVQGRSRLCLAIRKKIDILQVSKSYGARILGFYGVAGIGKTTACKVICNDYFDEFEGKVCFIEFGVRSKLQMLQDLLKTLTETNQKLIKTFSEDQCKDRLKSDLKKKVFLAIDNVSDTQQTLDDAKDLLRMGFVKGSIVIVSARSRPQLRNLNLEDCIPMPELEEGAARSLLLYHAAPSLYLKNGGKVTEQLMKQCMERCYFGNGDGINYHYHPLALKVLGGQLGNDLKEWSEKLNELDPFNQYQEEEKDHPIFSILGRSFDILKSEDKFLFMDAAIFFPQRWGHGLKLQKDISIFEWLSMVHGKSPYVIKRRLEGLKNKSLLENLGDGSEGIGMHDLWREFAGMKAKKGQFDSRPGTYEKVFDLKDRRREETTLSGGGWESLQRICMVGDTEAGAPCIVKEINLSRCSNLTVLKLVDVYLETRKLDVRSLKQLKSMEIFHDPYGLTPPLSHILGLGCLRNLVYLNLIGLRTDVAFLHEEIGGLTSLKILHVRNLRSWPIVSPDFTGLSLLQNMTFSFCGKVEIISGLSSKMINLKRLDLSNGYFMRLCHGVGDLVALEELDLSRCSLLQELPHLARLAHLLKLNLRGCEAIRAVPGLGDLVSLKVFETYGCFKLTALPDMRKLVNLQVLDVRGCPLIKALPGLSELVALEELEADSGALESCHDLRKLTKLARVGIRGWSAQGLPCLSGLESVKSLQIDDGKGADEWSSLVKLPGLQELRIRSCSFKDVPCLSNFTALKSLDISFCNKLERLPDMHELSKLETVSVSYCGSLREWKSKSGLRLFGADVHVAGTLVQLKTLTLVEVALTKLPDLSCFPQLRTLVVDKCQELMRLTCMSPPLHAREHLELSECGSLRALPDASHLVSLKSFKLRCCGGVQLTAHETQQLAAICSELAISGASHLPNIGGARDAKRLKSSECVVISSAREGTL